MEKKRVYLSMPISGYDLEERRAMASRKKKELEEEGFLVVNPLDNGLPDHAGTHAHMRRDIGLLLDCDAIYLMARFTHSAGCMTEFHVATSIGLEVYFEECHSLEGGLVKFI